MNKAATISPEINLLGLTVSEAIAELDKYLDDAYLSNLNQVRVIHGKGTGTQLMKYAISELKAKIGCKKIIMDAQSGFFVYPSQKENGTNEQDEPAKIKNWTLKPFAGKTVMLTSIQTSTSA